MEKQKKQGENKVKKQVIITLSIVAVILVLSVLAGVIFGAIANAVKDPIAECRGVKLPLSFYELMLATTKGDLERSGAKIGYDSFWDSKSVEADKTCEQYYTDLVMNNCKRYLSALCLFEEMGLTLPETYMQEIEEDIAFYIDYDADGSREKFNEILAPYGVDIESLREAYIIRAKVEYLQISLYGEDGSLVTDTVKEEYYQKNYHRYKQIFVSGYYYEYQRDSYEKEIYFDAPSNGKPLYDTVNGSRDFDENRDFIKDKYGCEIYFDENGEPLYDTEKGYRYAVLDEKGNAKRSEYSKEEMKQRATLAEGIFASVKAGDFSGFDKKVADTELNDDYLAAGYTDGYYVSDLERSRYTDYENKYMSDVLDALKDMKTGDVKTVESKDGYHIIMKYELDKGAYGKENYESGFAAFMTSLTAQLFVDKCDKIIPDIVMNDENLKKARSIRELGSNLYYGYFYS